MREWLLGKAYCLSTFARFVDIYLLPNSTPGGKRCKKQIPGLRNGCVPLSIPHSWISNLTSLRFVSIEVWHIFSILREPITWGWTTCPWSTVPERPRLLLFNIGWTVWWAQVISPEATCVLTPVQLFKISVLITCIAGKSVTFSSWGRGGITEAEEGGVEHTQRHKLNTDTHIYTRNESFDVLRQVPAFNTNRQKHSKSSHSTAISFSRLCFTAK